MDRPVVAESAAVLAVGRVPDDLLATVMVAIGTAAAVEAAKAAARASMGLG